MKSVLFAVCAAFFVLTVFSRVSTATTLATDGRAIVPIVVSDTASKAELYAAAELKEHLDKIAGADFKILKLSETKDAPSAIYVGDSPKTRRLLPDLDPKKLPFDAIIIKTVGDNIVLGGHPKRGTIFAVETFLEDNLGVRWWTDKSSFIPKNATIKTGKINVEYAPVFKHRRLDYTGWQSEKFTARLRAGDLVFRDKDLQRKTNNGFAIGYHSFWKILPPEKYFKAHPEWYSMGKNGKRLDKFAQLCLTNEEMVAEFAKRTLEKLRARPDCAFVHISQNDWYNNCLCKKCKDFEAAHGGEPSATIVNFANKIAAAVEKEFPDVRIVTFAYQYGRHAPKNIEPRKNVWIELCSIECDFAHPLESDTDYGFTKDIQDWAKLTQNLTIWNYVTNFTNHLYTFPNLYCLAPDMRFFAKNHAVGLFEQADNYCNVGDFVKLRHWVMAHLMWNPNLDERTLVREFLDGYYSPEVGKYLYKYLDTINRRAAKVKYAQSCYMEDNLVWIDIDTFNKSTDLIKKAIYKAIEQEKSDPEKYRGLVEKVRRDKLSFDYFSMMNYANVHMLASKQGKKISGAKDPVSSVEQIISIFKQYRTRGLIPNSKREDFEKSWWRIRKAAATQKAFVAAHPKAFESNDIAVEFPRGSFYDFQEDAIFQSRDSDRRQRIVCELIPDKNASNGYAAKMFDNKKMEINLRNYLVDLKSPTGLKKTRSYQVFAYVSTKGKNVKIKSSTSGWQNAKTGDEYRKIHLGSYAYSADDIAKKYLFCRRYEIRTDKPEDLLVDRVLFVSD